MRDSPPSSSERQPTMEFVSPEAFVMTAVAGCVDAVGFITFAGLFVAHMSGNSAALGAWFGQGIWTKALPHLFAVPVFLAGLVAGHMAMEQCPTPRRCAALVLLEAALLIAFVCAHVFVGPPGFLSPTYFLMASILLLAMGMQNATLRRIGRSGFPSTYVTGILDAFGHSIASVLLGRDGHRNSRIARNAGGLWLAYILGATAASAGLIKIGAVILAMPIIALFVVARTLGAKARTA